jgi:hypothetical protein
LQMLRHLQIHPHKMNSKIQSMKTLCHAGSDSMRQGRMNMSQNRIAHLPIYFRFPKMICQTMMAIRS